MSALTNLQTAKLQEAITWMALAKTALDGLSTELEVEKASLDEETQQVAFEDVVAALFTLEDAIEAIDNNLDELRELAGLPTNPPEFTK